MANYKTGSKIAFLKELTCKYYLNMGQNTYNCYHESMLVVLTHEDTVGQNPLCGYSITDPSINVTYWHEDRQRDQQNRTELKNILVYLQQSDIKQICHCNSGIKGWYFEQMVLSYMTVHIEINAT